MEKINYTFEVEVYDEKGEKAAIEQISAEAENAQDAYELASNKFGGTLAPGWTFKNNGLKFVDGFSWNEAKQKTDKPFEMEENIKRIVYNAKIFFSFGEPSEDTMTAIGEDNPDTMDAAFANYKDANPCATSFIYISHGCFEATIEEREDYILAQKKKKFNKALENFGEPVQPQGGTSLKDINDEISKVNTHNHVEVKKLLDSFDSPSSGSGQAIQDDADHTPPAAPAKSGLSAPPEGNETFTFTFMVIKGIDTMDSYIDVPDVEAKTEHEAFLIACEQVTISCPEKRKIWYKGKPLEHYGYVPKTIPQDGKK